MKNQLDQCVNFITKLVEKGGPDPNEYDLLNHWVGEVSKKLKLGVFTTEDLKHIRNCFGDVLSIETLLGHTLIKPYGYAGDYELIDKIYQKYITPNLHFKKWDLFYQAHKATNAVRKRKTFFKNFVRNLCTNGNSNKLEVLNIGSGPGRDVFEFLNEDGTSNVLFECVDMDENAISYAKNLCKEHSDKIIFQHENIFKYSSNKKYHLIWSAGLFDYLDDESFKFLLKKSLNLLQDKGEIVIGNASKDKATMDICHVIVDWILHHRNKDDLIRLASECGIQNKNIKITQEPEEIFYFLHIKLY
ncbi:MAG: class I SAM-dependent methyltransferase [Promethearchaeota archaeon]